MKGNTHKFLNFVLTLAMAFFIVSAFGISVSAETKTLTVGGNLFGEYQLVNDVNLNTNITVKSGKSLTIDLNGHVLIGTGSGSAITNKGTLVIKDSNSAAEHYFKVNSDGLWVYQQSWSGTADYDYVGGVLKLHGSEEEFTGIPESDKVILVKGGCITSGSAVNGGGIYNNGTLTISGGNMVGNRATAYGGGVYSLKDKTFTMSSGNIIGNVVKSDSNYVYGGGIYLRGISTLSGGNVSYNTALCTAGGKRSYGGGIYIHKDSTIADSKIKDMIICGNTSKASGSCLVAFGGGLATDSCSTIEVKNTKIKRNEVIAFADDGNTVTDGSNVYGGGIYTASNMSLTENTEISENTAKVETLKNGTSNRQAFGGGIYLKSNETSPTELTIGDDSVKVCTNSAVSTYKAQGGGVYLPSNCKFIITAGLITGNIVNAYYDENDDEAEGGGVCVCYNTSEFIVGGTAKIIGNTGYNGNDSNVYLRKAEGGDALISISAITAPSNGMSIGVTVADTYKDIYGEYRNTVFPQYVTAANDSDYSTYFTSDNNNSYYIKKGTSNEVTLAPIFDDRFGGKVNLNGDGVGYKKYDTYTSEENPYLTSKGYTFAGWYTGIDGTGNKLSGEPDSNKTYYAKWEKSGKTIITQKLDFTIQGPRDEYANEKNGIHWVESENKLILNGAWIESWDYGLYLPAGTTLDVQGESTIIVNRISNAICVNVCGELTVTGDNKLTLSSSENDSYGVIANGAVLTIDNAVIDVNVKTGGLVSTCGTADQSNIVITNGSIIAIDMNDTGYGIFNTTGNISIEGSTTSVTVEKCIHGIRANGNLIISCGAVNVFANTDSNAKSIYSESGSITLSGNVSASVNNEEDDSWDDDEHRYVVSAGNGSVTILGVNTEVILTGGSIGIHTTDAANITDGKVQIRTGTTGIWAANGLVIEDATIDVRATATGTKGVDKSTEAKGINAQGGNIVISGSADVKSIGVDYGIRAKSGNITITGNDAVVIANGNSSAYVIGGTFTADNAVVKTGEDETDAAFKTGDVKSLITGAKYASVKFVFVTVSFDAQNGSGVTTQSAFQYGNITKPSNPEKYGYTFGGWYSDEKCENAWNFESDRVTDSMMLYAKWIKNSETKAVISGTVTDGANVVTGAVIELKLGTEKVAAAISDENGEYSFDNVENGLYNIVITKGDKTKTAMVDVNEANSFTANVTLPAKEVSSKVELKEMSTLVETAKADVSEVVVGGVDTIAEDENPSGADKISIVLTVEPKAENNADAAQAAIKTQTGNKTVEFVDFKLTKQINDETPSDIGNTNTKLLTITLPMDTTGINVNSITVYRYHDSAAALTKITNPANKADGTYMVSDGIITIYAEKFSTYAIAYTVKQTSSIEYYYPTYTVTNIATENGTVAVSKIYALYQETITVTATPNEGYVLTSIKVTDNAGNELALKKCGNNKYSFVMPKQNVSVKAEFAENVPYSSCAKDSTCIAAKFIDINTKAWYHNGLHFCVANGYMNGYGNGLFGPNDSLSRGMVVTILYNMEGNPTIYEKSSFTDVDKNSWYADAIAWAEDHDIVYGYGDGLFGPEDDVTREQLASILYRYAKYKGYDVTKTTTLTQFTDADKTSNWALESLKWANAVKLVSGKGNGILDPTGKASRAEAATMIMNFCENLSR